MLTQRNFIQSFYPLKHNLLIKAPPRHRSMPLDTEERINLTLVINDKGT